MVFHQAEQHSVPFHEFLAVTIRYHVDGFCSTSDEDYLARAFCIDKPCNFFSSFFELLSRLLAEFMHSSVNIGIRFCVEFLNSSDYLDWPLSSCCIVKVHEGLSIHLS